MKIRHLIVGAAALTLPFGVAACGGSDDNNSGDRPSAEEIADSFAEQLPEGIPNADAIADCVGKGLEESDLPNGVLRSIAAGEDEQSIDPENEEEYTKIVTDVSTECAAGAATGG
jgi:hypothetical protein